MLKIRPATSYLDENIRARSARPAGEVCRTVGEILAAVKDRGDEAVLEFTARFDRASLTPEQLRLDPDRLKKAWQALEPRLRTALETMYERLVFFHEKQLPQGFQVEDGAGNRLGQVVRPLARVGIYAPGGRAAYPSSVLMGLVPARIAGVRERYVVTPPGPEGSVNELVLAAAYLGGATAVFTVGGAQAIAALTYGTETIPAVDKIVGPGNVYVTEAKAQVAHQVGIDSLAGPSEVVVVADAAAPVDWVALELLAQAEHDPDAVAILVTPAGGLARAVQAELVSLLETAPRREIAAASLEANGVILQARDLEEAMEVANRLAPEHLSLYVEDTEGWLGRIYAAGAVFLGAYSPVVAGDYTAGTNHVLPTGGTARFAAGLNVEDFLRRVNYFAGTAQGVAAWAPAARRLAEAEGLFAHAQAAAARLQKG